MARSGARTVQEYLAAQKHHFAVYAHGLYMDPAGEARVRSEFEQAGKRLDMGESADSKAPVLRPGHPRKSLD